MDLEESCNFLVTEAGAIEMNNQRKTEPLEEFERYEKYRDYLEQKRK